MKLRTILLSSLAGIALVASLARLADAGDAADANRPPNFVIIFTDDQGYGDLGCFGATTFATPRLDRMAEEGIRLTGFYAQQACGPSRCALLTGRYPKRIEHRDRLVPTEEVTIAEVLKTAGYATCCIGKWDCSRRRYSEGVVPNDQGFDHYFGTLGANDHGRVRLWRDRKQLHQTDDMGSLTKLYTDEAIRFLEEHEDRPFFLYLAHTMPHVKLGASEAFLGKSQRGLYGDVIEEIDWNVGRVLDTLDRLGLSNNTIVWFSSDNGPWLTKGKNGGSAGPLREGKGSAWEGGFRVPSIVWGPGHVPGGRTSDAMASTLDILPTFAAMAGAEPPPGRVLDGRDQTALITGKTDVTARDTFFYYIEENLHAVRQGKWKLALPNRKKFRPYAKDKTPVTTPELYDLENDVGEKHDVADAYPEVVRDLLKLADHVRDELGDMGPPRQ